MVLEGCGGSEPVLAGLDLPGVVGWRHLGQGWSEPSQGLADRDVNRGAGVQIPLSGGWSGGGGCSSGPSEEAMVKG